MKFLWIFYIGYILSEIYGSMLSEYLYFAPTAKNKIINLSVVHTNNQKVSSFYNVSAKLKRRNPERLRLASEQLYDANKKIVYGVIGRL